MNLQWNSHRQAVLLLGEGSQAVWASSAAHGCMHSHTCTCILPATHPLGLEGHVALGAVTEGEVGVEALLGVQPL